VGVIKRTSIRNLEPVTVTFVVQEVAVRRAREVNDTWACMPKVWAAARTIRLMSVSVAVSRDPEAHLGAGEDIDCLGVRRRIECISAAGDVRVIGSNNGV
jgi:hypothetical protein